MTQSPESQTPASPETELDADALNAIRSILTEQEAPAPAREATARQRKADRLPPLEAPAHDPQAQGYADEMLAPKPAKWRFSLRRKRAEPAAQTAARKPAKAVRNARKGVKRPGKLSGLTDQVRGYRPKKKHIALALVALVVLLRPWLVLGLTFIFLLIMIGVFLILGYDGFWQTVMRLSRWYADRRPARAAALHARIDQFAMRWDAVLDRFPEGSVDALYLPDFGELADAERRHDEALERRLSGMHGKGA